MRSTAVPRTVFLLLAPATALQAGEASPSGAKPNIVVILADDFGVGDIQAHYPANKIPTPHLDRLVRQGRSFTDAHSSSAVCSSTRDGLLTGRYNWRMRLREWGIAAYEPPLIAADRPTLPGLLRRHGYHTACIGKWHLGWEWPGPQPRRMTERHNGQAQLEWDFTRPLAGGPAQRGFDDYFGVDLPNLPPFTYIENDRVTPLPTARFQPDSNDRAANRPFQSRLRQRRADGLIGKAPGHRATDDAGPANAHRPWYKSPGTTGDQRHAGSVRDDARETMGSGDGRWTKTQKSSKTGGRRLIAKGQSFCST